MLIRRDDVYHEEGTTCTVSSLTMSVSFAIQNEPCAPLSSSSDPPCLSVGMLLLIPFLRNPHRHSSCHNSLRFVRLTRILVSSGRHHRLVGTCKTRIVSGYPPSVRGKWYVERRMACRCKDMVRRYRFKGEMGSLTRTVDEKVNAAALPSS